MTVTGGFPAPGPQDREPPPHRPPAATSDAGSMANPGTPMLTAHKPGIVPLRPLQLSDILDGAVKAVRFNPKPMVGLSAVVLAVFLVPSAALGIGATHLAARVLSTLGPDAGAFLGLSSSVIQAVSTELATALLSGVLIYVVGQAVLGRKPDIGATWRSTRGRLPSLLALAMLSGLFSLLATMLLIGPGVLLLINNDLGTGLLVLFVGLLSLIAVALAVSTKISMAAPAIVLEGHGNEAEQTDEQHEQSCAEVVVDQQQHPWSDQQHRRQEAEQPGQHGQRQQRRESSPGGSPRRTDIRFAAQDCLPNDIDQDSAEEGSRELGRNRLDHRGR